MASVIAFLCFAFVLTGCTGTLAARKALTEANPLSSGIYHIEMTGSSNIALLAYKTEVIDLNGSAEWVGIATVGAYGMVFEQKCHSLYSDTRSVKEWRDNWVYTLTTSPRLQMQQWLQECQRHGRYEATAVPAASVLPLPQDDTRMVVSLYLKETSVDWGALCDAHIDTLFGSQAFLTDASSGSATLYFDTETFCLIGAHFTAQSGQTTLSAFITVSTADGHAIAEFPEPERITEGTLSEEWRIATADDVSSGED